ncbi:MULTISPECIES: DUF4124 domain-containing protein [Vibrio]|uniref:DUF4124 domain-containing protein n=1 Tax=Vibrio bivalvicida TaxID=1276888 RepID=A0A177Y5C4_9VIBR|nr:MULTISPECIES: DUF4124 domain-containing protein [Vibrio]KLN65504.1 hypothetical protein ZX61_07810 [Vibrio sp. VPAP30]OAJ96068.1 hypothetical protein APB76_00735 [Vibrio bivalvicida]
MQRFYISIATMLLISSTCYTQTIYTWVDDSGARHFSDSRAVEHATSIELPKLEQSASPHQVSEPLAQDNNQDIQYQTATPTPLVINITDPEHDSTQRSNNGSLELHAKLNRELNVGEQLQLIVNGSKYGVPTTTAEWHLKNLDRGAHSFLIQAFRYGKLIASSKSITVHLLRASINSVKQRPNS